VKRRSIGFRLAAWYSLVFGCGLAVFGVAAWFAMRASVYHAIDDELRDRVRGIAQYMTNPASPSSLAEMRNEMREHAVLGPGGDLLQVCDQRGDLLLRQTGPERDSANPNPNPRAQPVLRRVVGYVEDLLAKSEIAAYPPRAHEILTKVGVAEERGGPFHKGAGVS